MQYNQVVEMSGKNSKKSASSKKSAPVKEVEAPAPKASKKKSVKVEPVPDPEEEVKQPEVEKKPRVRRELSKETVDAGFESLIKRVEDEILKLQQSDKKVTGVRLLRSLNKLLKQLHKDSRRVLKIKSKTVRNNKPKSGFLKPVNISEEMAKFTGWDPNNIYSRVDVTRFICSYVKNNKLRDEKDKRIILCDDRLKALLKYDPAKPDLNKDGEPIPLNYFLLQRYLKPHFINTAPAADAAPKKEKPAKKGKKAAAKEPESESEVDEE